MNKFAGRIALILFTTLVGVYAIYPPGETLKTGIDLSGGTILVYGVKKDATSSSNANLDELIAALKRRINPQGVEDIAIRKVGNDRIEIVLPKKSTDEVDDIKRKLTNVGSLEFRILANHRHDGSVADRALSPSGLAKPPKNYRWATLGETITGNKPDGRAGRARPPRPQPPLGDELAGGPDRLPDGQELRRGRAGQPPLHDRRQHPQRLHDQQAARPGHRQLVPNRLQPEPD